MLTKTWSQHISGDGSCLFNAIAASIGNQDGNRLRKLAALKLTHYQDDGLNEATVGQGIDRGTGLSITGYQRHMVRGASRGGQIDLALLSEAVQCSIEVYRRVGTGHFMRERVFGAHFEDTVRVVFDGSHYDALVQQSMQACMGGYQGASGSKLVNLLDDKWTKRRFGQVVQGFPAPKSKEEHTATVIWLHGLGDTGFGWAPVTETFRMPHIKFLFPTAPTEAVTLNMGMQVRVSVFVSS